MFPKEELSPKPLGSWKNIEYFGCVYESARGVTVAVLVANLGRSHLQIWT